MNTAGPDSQLVGMVSRGEKDSKVRKRITVTICTMVATTALMTALFAATAPTSAMAGFHWGKCPPGQAKHGNC